MVVEEKESGRSRGGKREKERYHEAVAEESRSGIRGESVLCRRRVLLLCAVRRTFINALGYAYRVK